MVEKVTADLWTWPWRKRWKQTNKRKEGPRWRDVTPRRTNISHLYSLPTLEKAVQPANWRSLECVVMENAVKERKDPSMEPIQGLSWTWWISSYYHLAFSQGVMWYRQLSHRHSEQQFSGKAIWDCDRYSVRLWKKWSWLKRIWWIYPDVSRFGF